MHSYRNRSRPATGTADLRLFPLLVGIFLLLLAPAVEAAGPALSLHQAINRALENNPRLQAGSTRIESAKAGKEASQGTLYPRLDAYAGYTRTNNPMLIIPMKALPPASTPEFTRNHYRAGLNAVLPLYEGGRRWAKITMAELGEKISRQGLASSRQEIIAAVTRTFDLILSLAALEKAQGKALAALEKARDDARRRLQLGRAAPVEVMKMDTQVADQRYALTHTRQARLRARQQLAALLGDDPGAPPEVSGRLSTEVNIPEATGADDQKLVAARPDLQKAARQIELTDNKIKLENGGNLPDISLVGDYGRRAGSGMNDHEEVWSAGVNLTFNLFAGGSISARVRQAEKQRETARQEYRNLKLQALTEVHQARTRIAEARSKLKMADQAIASARETYRIEELKYKTGAGTITDSLLAQAAWFQAEALKADALYELNTAAVDLELALGTIDRDFSPPADSQATADKTAAAAPAGPNPGE